MKRGKPATYINKEEYQRLKDLGYTDKLIAHLMGHSAATISQHKKLGRL